MKTRIQKAKAIGILVILSAVLGSCSENSQKKKTENNHPMIGKWVMYTTSDEQGELEGEIEFYEDWTFKGDDPLGNKQSGVWMITKAGNLRTEYSLDYIVPKEWKLAFSGDECVISPVHKGESMRFVRKK